MGSNGSRFYPPTLPLQHNAAFQFQGQIIATLNFSAPANLNALQARAWGVQILITTFNFNQIRPNPSEKMQNDEFKHWPRVRAENFNKGVAEQSGPRGQILANVLHPSGVDIVHHLLTRRSSGSPLTG